MNLPPLPPTTRPYTLGLAMLLAFIAGCALVVGETGDKVIFDNPLGLVLNNYTPWFPGYVKLDNPVQLDDYTTVTLDFSLPVPVDNLLYRHRTGWTPNGQVFSDQYMRGLSAGRQQHTLRLDAFEPVIDHTVGLYFNARDVTLYSATLGTNPLPEPPTPAPNRVIVSGPEIEVFRQIGRTWWGAEEICGEVEYVFRDQKDDENPLNGTVYVLRFGGCDGG